CRPDRRVPAARPRHLARLYRDPPAGDVMSCCAPGAEGLALLNDASRPQELLLASRPAGEGLRQSDLSVPGIHCAGCIGTIERGLAKLPGVARVRVNLSMRRVAVQWAADRPPPDLVRALRDLGYEATLFSFEDR